MSMEADDGCPGESLSTLQEELLRHGLELDQQKNVHWQSNNSDHPRNWSTTRKSYDIGLIIFLDFFTTAISNAGTPASKSAGIEFGIEGTLAIFVFVSVYLIGQALGGLFFPPISESFGRKKLYVVSTVLYAITCFVVAAIPSIAAVVTGRFVSGVLSAIPTIVVAGSIEDLFASDARIWMIFMWAMVANLGLVVGPIFATYISLSIGWRWIFYLAAIVTGIVSILLLGIKESRPSQLLSERLESIKKVTGDLSIRFENPDHSPDLKTFMQLALLRPLRLLFTEPIVFLVSTMTAAAFGLIYLFTDVIQIVYNSFGFSNQQSSLALIPIGIGLMWGILPRIYDNNLSKRARRRGKELEPEEKLTGFVIGAPVLAAGLWLFAWTIPPEVPNVHWIVSMIGLVFVGFASNEFDCVLAGYMADSYTLFSASAFASLSLTRAIFSATFPLFSTPMVTYLGANDAVRILAAGATVVCIFPMVFLRYGKQIRQSSKFASYSLEVYNQNRVDGR